MKEDEIMSNSKNKSIKIIINIMLTVCTACMVSMILFYDVSAKDSFKKQIVMGVMSTVVEDKVVVTWEGIIGATGYDVYEWSSDLYSLDKTTGEVTDVRGTSAVDTNVSEPQLAGTTKTCRIVLSNRKPGTEYHYYVVAYRTEKGISPIYGRKSEESVVTVPFKGKSTIKNFLRIALAPVGNTMYVWGGGWNKADTAAGKEAKSIGLSSSWRSFAMDKKSNYNYRNYRYLIHKGLDCSGYVGWCVYNVNNTANGKKGYVYSASKQAKKFAKMGFGSYRKSKDVTDYKPGDIMSSSCSCCGHVWIVIGQCDDGSVVIAHASPPGVVLSGTVTPKGKKNSEAVKLARKYMKKYYYAWYKKYPDVCKGSSYLSHYGQMRWDTEGENCVLSDPDGYEEMSAEEVLKDLFGETLEK